MSVQREGSLGMSVRDEFIDAAIWHGNLKRAESILNASASGMRS